MNPATAPRYLALDSLRGIAAVGVAFHHIFALHGPAALPLFVNGPLFVDFFFVLSGFVIAASYGERLAQGFSLRRFAMLRLGRVWPLHAAMVAVALAVEGAAALFGDQGLGNQPPFQGTHSPGHALMSLLLLVGFQPDIGNFYSGVGWSISVELLLYALAALAFRAGRRGLAVLLALVPLAVAGQIAGINLPVLTFGVLRGVAGFGVGTGCWLLHRRLPRHRGTRATLLEAVALTALFGAIWLIDTDAGNALVIAPAALVVLVFAGEGGAISWALGRGPWVWLGTISYSIYMVHPMVEGRAIDLLLLLSRRTGYPIADRVMIEGLPFKRLLLDPVPSTVVQIAILGLVLVTAQFAWRLIEEPARLASRRYAATL